MKFLSLLSLLLMLFNSSDAFDGCPMDGCDRTLSGFVDINVNGFNPNVEWRRTDLLNHTSRGCVSNGMYSVICAVDTGYVSINITNGELIWSITLNSEEKSMEIPLPVVNYQGYSIIANDTRCALINPQGEIVGTFNFHPKLISPLAGPFVTDNSQIVVGDLNAVSYKYFNLSFFNIKYSFV